MKLLSFATENSNEQNFKQMNNLKNPMLGSLLSFGVKSVLLKQDYKAIETHKYTKEELALIEIEEIKREIEEINLLVSLINEE